MEGLPHLALTVVSPKQCINHDDFDFLPNLIRYRYGMDPNDFRRELSELTRLRAFAASRSYDAENVKATKRYYSQLQLLEGRFRFNDDLSMEFTWEDTFSGREVALCTLDYEKASVLYNIGAKHMLLASHQDRLTPESLKFACTDLQNAAWAFSAIIEIFPHTDVVGDLTPSFCQLMSDLCIAQAQECILSKALTDQRPASVISKLCKFLAQSYARLNECLGSSILSTVVPSRLRKDLRARFACKSSLFRALAQYHAGEGALAESKYGLAVGFCQAAVESIKEAQKLCKDVPDNKDQSTPGASLSSGISFAFDVIKGRCTSLVKDNEFIYHDRVVPADQLPTIEPACLAKSISFDPNDEAVRGEDIFRRLMPLETVQAASIYSEKKSQLLRQLTSQAAEKEDEMQKTLSSLRLNPDTLLAEDEPLPQSLFDVCATLGDQVDTHEREMCDHMAEMNKLKEEVSGEMSRLGGELQAVRQEAADGLRAQAFSDMKAGSQALLAGQRLLERHKGLMGNLAEAQQSHEQLRRAVDQHVAVLRQLAQPIEQLELSLPSVQPLIADPVLREQLEKVRKVLAKVDEMMCQRKELIAELRRGLDADEVTASLLTGHVDHDKLFSERLKKFDGTVNLIQLNMKAQANIIGTLVDLNASVAATKLKIIAQREARGKQIDLLVRCGSNLQNLMDKSVEGCRFYRDLSANLDGVRGEMEETRARINALKLVTPTAAAPTQPTPTDSSRAHGMRLKDYMAAGKTTNPAVPQVNASQPPVPNMQLPRPYFPEQPAPQQPQQPYAVAPQPPHQQYAARPQPTAQTQQQQHQPPRPYAPQYYGRPPEHIMQPKPAQPMHRPQAYPPQQPLPYHAQSYAQQPHQQQQPRTYYPPSTSQPQQPQQPQPNVQGYHQPYAPRPHPGHPNLQQPATHYNWRGYAPPPPQRPYVPLPSNSNPNTQYTKQTTSGDQQAAASAYQPQAPSYAVPGTHNPSAYGYVAPSQYGPYQYAQPSQPQNGPVAPTSSERRMPEGANQSNPGNGLEATNEQILSSLAPITPHVITAADREEQSREAKMRAAAPSTVAPAEANQSAPLATGPKLSVSAKDGLSSAPPAADAEAAHLNDPMDLNRFIHATETALSWIETRSMPSDEAGLTRLNFAWQRIETEAARGPSSGAKRPTQAVARLCVGKNRSQDSVPYDSNRVVLTTTKEDYVNASLVELMQNLGAWCPRYILAQKPLASTQTDYWTMVFEQGCELVVLLSSADETSSAGGHLPETRMSLPRSALEVRLQTTKRVSGSWIERILTLHNRDHQQTRTLVHLQYEGVWPAVEASLEPLLEFLQEMHNFYRQQRSLARPICVTSENGCGRNVLCVAASVGIFHIDRLNRYPDMVEIAAHVAKQRKNAWDNADQFVVCARLVAQHAIDVLSKRDIVVGPRIRKTTNQAKEPPKTCSEKKPSQVDGLLSGQDMSIDELMAAIKWAPQKRSTPPIATDGKAASQNDNSPLPKQENGNRFSELEELANINQNDQQIKHVKFTRKDFEKQPVSGLSEVEDALKKTFIS